MKLLLDTHIWTWAAEEPENLGARTADMLVDPVHELWLSPVSIWEVLTLFEKNRFRSVDRNPKTWLKRALSRWPLKDAAMSREIMLELGRFTLPQKDPADRFLVATARALGLRLVTADRKIIASGAVSVVPND